MTTDKQDPFDAWMLTKNPKYAPSDDTVELRWLRECWKASRYQALGDALGACKQADLNADAKGERWTLTAAHHIIASLQNKVV